MAWIRFEGKGLGFQACAPQLLPVSRGGEGPAVGICQSHASPAVVGESSLSSLLKVGTATIPLSDSFLSSLVHCPHLSSLCHSSVPCNHQYQSQFLRAPLTGYNLCVLSLHFQKGLNWCGRVPPNLQPKKKKVRVSKCFLFGFGFGFLSIPLPSKREDHAFNHPPSREERHPTC